VRTATATALALVAILAGCGPPDDDAASSARSEGTASATAECVPSGELPDRRCTPGAMDRRVTQASLATTACRPGWSASVRPPTSYTDPIKRAMLGTEVVTLQLKGSGGRPVDVTVRPYGPYAGGDPSDYELDHLVPIAGMGGDPWAIENLWLEAEPGGRNEKDGMESRLRAAVCSGQVSLDDARQAFATDWRTARALIP
jgi:hypothetical protein